MKVNRIDNLHGNSILWRYMSIEKFLHLLSNQTLYFANASKMEDRNEITFPDSFWNWKLDEYIKRGQNPDNAKKSINKEIEVAKLLKDSTYLNCWSLNESESYALWKIYLSGSVNGVAIKTRTSKLISSIESSNQGVNISFDSVNLAKVNYGDYGNADKPSLIKYKDKIYDYEKEVRLFIRTKGEYNYDDSSSSIILYNSIQLPVDLDILIESIVLSPFAAPWVNKIYEEIINRFEPKFSNKIENSEIFI